MIPPLDKNNEMCYTLIIERLEMKRDRKVINPEEYLGDGICAGFDGYSYKLTTEDGEGTNNTIYLEPSVLNSLMDFIKKVELAKEE